MAVEAQVERGSAGTMQVSFSAPEALENVTMLWDGETVKMQLFGIETAFGQDDLPSAALGKALIGVLDEALRKQSEPQRAEEGLLYTGSFDGHAFELIADPESGALRELRIPSLDIHAMFSAFTVKE